MTRNSFNKLALEILIVLDDLKQLIISQSGVDLNHKLSQDDNANIPIDPAVMYRLVFKAVGVYLRLLLRALTSRDCLAILMWS